ncbi:unnamed protein product [Vitrella brassicaformis CCMP3155]|uniref:Transmembrane protein n=1 Tax=Vitrella brassicaformis (strain CCMP3155) TaxID=1169540 RepID=A0A0G4EXQ1_VITBC|nr:unnamed protein product [Vitrella brassicaformis CCMP3155]|eukprot:CEM04089.1 unnamed protein product [Vitrella brassicaformis CCMP3155]
MFSTHFSEETQSFGPMRKTPRKQRENRVFGQLIYFIVAQCSRPRSFPNDDSLLTNEKARVWKAIKVRSTMRLTALGLFLGCTSLFVPVATLYITAIMYTDMPEDILGWIVCMMAVLLWAPSSEAHGLRLFLICTALFVLVAAVYWSHEFSVDVLEHLLYLRTFLCLGALLGTQEGFQFAKEDDDFPLLPGPNKGKWDSVPAKSKQPPKTTATDKITEVRTATLTHTDACMTSCMAVHQCVYVVSGLAAHDPPLAADQEKQGRHQGQEGHHHHPAAPNFTNTTAQGAELIMVLVVLVVLCVGAACCWVAPSPLLLVVLGVFVIWWPHMPPDDSADFHEAMEDFSTFEDAREPDIQIATPEYAPPPAPHQPGTRLAPRPKPAEKAMTPAAEEAALAEAVRAMLKAQKEVEKVSRTRLLPRSMMGISDTFLPIPTDLLSAAPPLPQAHTNARARLVRDHRWQPRINALGPDRVARYV